MQWCRPSPKINSGRTLIPSDVILKNSSHTLSLQWCQVSHFLTPFPGRRRGQKYFERVETGAFHTLFASQYFSLLVHDSRIPFPGGRDGRFSHIFCKSVIFYPLFLDSRKIFEGVGMENFHTFFASQSFYLLILDNKDKEIIRRMTGSRLPYGIWVTVLALN